MKREYEKTSITENTYHDIDTKEFFRNASQGKTYSSDEGFKLAKSLKDAKPIDYEYIINMLYACICYEVYLILCTRIPLEDVDMICTKVAMELMKDIYNYVLDPRSIYEYNRRGYVRKRAYFRMRDYYKSTGHRMTEKELREFFETCNMSRMEIDSILEDSKDIIMYASNKREIPCDDFSKYENLEVTDIFNSIEDAYLRRSFILATYHFLFTDKIDRLPYKKIMFAYQTSTLSNLTNKNGSPKKKGGTKEALEIIQDHYYGEIIYNFPRHIMHVINMDDMLSEAEVSYLLSPLISNLDKDKRYAVTMNSVFHYIDVKAAREDCTQIKSIISTYYDAIMEEAHKIYTMVYNSHSYSNVR